MPHPGTAESIVAYRFDSHKQACREGTARLRSLVGGMNATWLDQTKSGSGRPWSPLPLGSCKVFQLLVAVIAVPVTVRKTLAEVPTILLPITEARIVVLRSVLIVALVAVLETFTSAPVLAAFLDAVVV